ncbi:MAG: hypothetical protein KGJ80_12985 [Chloroflexota bacterium]|nr:hypothetical protein [Chloroflexota bacterium]
MLVYMDRTACSCWIAACERTFGWRIEHNDWGEGGCIVESRDDGKPEVTIMLKDRDGNKRMTITQSNRWDAYEGWSRVAARQTDLG